MEIRVVVVSLACLSCLVPPALGKALAAKAAAAGAAKGALVAKAKGAAIGVGLGLAGKGALALVAKKAILGILLKAAAIKGAMLLAKKKAAIKGVGGLALAGLSGIMSAAETSQADSSEVEERTTSSRPIIRDLLSGTARVMQATLRLGEAAMAKSRTVYRAISAVPRMISPDPLDD